MAKIFHHSFIIDIATTRGMSRFHWTGDGRKLRKVITARVSDWQQAWVIIDKNELAVTIYPR